MMTEELQDKLVELFWNGIEGYSWDDWRGMSAKDKEEIVPDVIMELGMEVDIDEVYDLFWEWADGLDEESFYDPEADYEAEFEDEELDDEDYDFED